MAQEIATLFIQSFAAGLLAVFTPFVYTILPLTVSYLSMGAATQEQKVRNLLYYALSIVIIFSLLGMLISLAIRFTGLMHYTGHWIFNLFFFRLFLMLGISLLGVFSFRLPAAWVNAMAAKAKA